MAPPKAEKSQIGNRKSEICKFPISNSSQSPILPILPIPRLHLHITGIVQGVGFRPFLHRLARECGLTGVVWNEGGSVRLEVQGRDLDSFLSRLQSDCPPMARIRTVKVEERPPIEESTFRILPSVEGGGGEHFVAPDTAVCEDCLRELFDPGDRRYRYPFLNCTQCGPRFTITRSLPYDRPSTSMSVFPQCPKCEAEYHDPGNRRFHAQPNACPVCGPRLRFTRSGSEEWEEDALQAALRLLESGGILALRGLGGYHLAVDAGNTDAVTRLRARKQRWAKPLAVMVRDLHSAELCVVLDEASRAVMTGPERPILLLPQRSPFPLSHELAPDNPNLGVMLPYTPLHHLLLAGPLSALVMTSGNLSEEPICIGIEEAESRLGAIADAFLHHDREILQRCDDSVLRLVAGAPAFIRRSRGWVPRALDLPARGPAILGVGGELKNTLCLAREGSAWMSQHIGDCERVDTLDFLEQALRHLRQLLKLDPVLLVHDRHPEYLSTRWAKEWAPAVFGRSLPLLAVQHHHAHFASCLAEHGLRHPALGIILDGAGYGDDGTIWGGEFFAGPPEHPVRLAHLPHVLLPGGDLATREPWRMAASWLWSEAGEDGWDLCASLGILPDHQATSLVLALLRHSQDGPRSSGAGRLFDAAAAILGLCTHARFEAEGAMALEAMASTMPDSVLPGIGDLKEPGALLLALARDRRAGQTPALLAARFHRDFALWCAERAASLARDTGLRQVALSGGVFQNALFSAHLDVALRARGLEPLHHRHVPANDAGLALGQAYIGTLMKGEVPCASPSPPAS